MNGFVIIEKPPQITSAKVVNQVKKMLPPKTKIGHTGTLDPNVTGVLPLAIGNATKSVAFMDKEIKIYRCTLTFGISSDTQDVWGNIQKQSQVALFSDGQIENALSHFTGQITQIPPMYSAVKFKGRRLYELARTGVEVVRNARKTTIYAFSDVIYQHPDLSFTVSCSRGTYIRTLCVDLADFLGVHGCMKTLDRTATGPFNRTHSIKLNALTKENLINYLMPVETLFKTLTKIFVDYRHAIYLINGVKVNLGRFYKNNPSYNKRYSVYYNAFFIGVAEMEQQQIRLKKSFVSMQDIEAYNIL